MAARNQDKAAAAAEDIRAARPTRRSRSWRSTSARSTRCGPPPSRSPPHTRPSTCSSTTPGSWASPSGHRRRLRDAVRHQPPRPLRAHRAAAARGAAGRRPPGRHRHQHRPPHGPRGQRRQPAPPRQLRRVEGLRPVEAGQLPLRPRAAAAVRVDAGAPAASLTAHPGLSNTDLQAVSVEETGGGFSQKFFHSHGRRHRHEPGPGRAAPAAGGHRSPGQGRRALRAAFVTNGPPVRRPILRRVGLSSGISRAVGGLRAGDRRCHRDRRRSGPDRGGFLGGQGLGGGPWADRRRADDLVASDRPAPPFGGHREGQEAVEVRRERRHPIPRGSSASRALELS